MRKIVWVEGLFLSQQHFQHRDRQIEETQALRFRTLNPFSWGLLSLNVDKKALENGRFRIQNCLAVFPDGRLVEYDAREDPTLVCDFEGRGGEVIEIFLALPENDRVEGISGYPGNGQLCAWEADYRQIADVYDGGREREVLLARPNLMVLTGAESREPFVTLKLAELLNEGDGTYRLRTDYIPPVVRIDTSQVLHSCLVQCIDIVGTRLHKLQDLRGDFGGGPADFARNDPLRFAQMQVLSSAYPQLLHFQRNPELHPESLYRLLCQVVGALNPFGIDDQAEEPAYRHAELGTVFPPLVRVLERLTRIEPATPHQVLKLVRESEGLLCASPVASELLKRASFFLQVDFDPQDPNWITDFARQVKAGSRESIEMIVASALPGARLVHTQRPPHRLAVKSGCEYFRLEPKGDFWNRIVEEESLAIFLPQAFMGAEVDLVTVQEG